MAQKFGSKHQTHTPTHSTFTKYINKYKIVDEMKWSTQLDYVQLIVIENNHNPNWFYILPFFRTSAKI